MTIDQPEDVDSRVGRRADHHNMGELQLLHLLGDALGPESLPVTDLSVAGTVVSHSHLHTNYRTENRAFPVKIQVLRPPTN